MNPTKNPSAVRSQTEIITAFMKLMSEMPYEEITVKSILIETKLSRKTFYRNFTSKSDVLISYIDQIMSEYLHTLEHIQFDTFLSIVDVIFLFCEKYKELIELLNKNHLMPLLLEKWNVIIPENHRQKHNATDTISDYIIAFNVGGIFNVIFKWINEKKNVSTEEIKKALINYLNHIQNINLNLI